MTISQTRAHDAIEAEDLHGAHNYAPLPVVLSHGEGVWVHDVEGRRYFDALSAYSALNFGHRHPRLVRAAGEQLERLTLTSRAFHNDQLGAFCAELAAFAGTDRVLPMNTGAEAVETGIKLARKWGYERKGVEPDRAEIVVCAGNFHGRTTTIVGFSDDPLARDGFGPFTPGFVLVPYGDADALRDGDRPEHRRVPRRAGPGRGRRDHPARRLPRRRAVDLRRGRRAARSPTRSSPASGAPAGASPATTRTCAPTSTCSGKALGGGILPVSAVVGTDEVLGVLRPGEHGSTFGGNPLACAVGREVIRLLADGSLAAESAALGDAAAARLRAAGHPAVREVRQRGLWLGIELFEHAPPARQASERLMERGVLAKDTHETTLRLAPPLTVTGDELDWALERLDDVLAGLL